MSNVMIQEDEQKDLIIEDWVQEVFCRSFIKNNKSLSILEIIISH